MLYAKTVIVESMNLSNPRYALKAIAAATAAMLMLLPAAPVLLELTAGHCSCERRLKTAILIASCLRRLGRILH